MPTSSSSTAITAAFDAICEALQVFGRCFFCLTLADDPHMACCLLRTVGSGVLGGTRKVVLTHSTQIACPAVSTSALICHRMVKFLQLLILPGTNLPVAPTYTLWAQASTAHSLAVISCQFHSKTAC